MAASYRGEEELARLAMFPAIFTALLAAAFSGAAMADSIDVNLNNDTIQAEYASYWRTADFTLGGLWNRDTHDWVATAGLLARGAKQTQGSRTEVGVGGKAYVVSVGDSDIRALGLGGAARVFPGNGPFGIGGYAFYAPNVVTGGDAKNFWEAGAHLDFEVIRDTADIYVGYRKLRAELNDGTHVTVDKGGHVGVRIRF
jgi:YfaZ precursor